MKKDLLFFIIGLIVLLIGITIYAITMSTVIRNISLGLFYLATLLSFFFAVKDALFNSGRE